MKAIRNKMSSIHADIAKVQVILDSVNDILTDEGREIPEDMFPEKLWELLGDLDNRVYNLVAQTSPKRTKSLCQSVDSILESKTQMAKQEAEEQFKEKMGKISKRLENARGLLQKPLHEMSIRDFSNLDTYISLAYFETQTK